MRSSQIRASLLVLASYLLGFSPAALAEKANTISPPNITILSTMAANFAGIGEWGFSALISTPEEDILFDTGFKARTVLDNAKSLNVTLGSIEKVVLTHFHTDHTGGLLTLRRAHMDKYPQALSKVYVGKGFFRQRYNSKHEPSYSLGTTDTQTFDRPEEFRAAAEALGIQFIEVSNTLEIVPGIFLTGPIPRIHNEENYSPGSLLKTKEGYQPDWIPESQVLGINTERGWMLISGCGHAGIVNASEKLPQTIDQPIVMGIGGFHLFRADSQTIAWTAGQLQKFGLQKFLGAHCTGVSATYQIGEALELPHSEISIGAVGTRVDSSLKIIKASIE
ncbi:MAG: MBL fold metallo-hydrolase [Pseudomonadales bacterium]|nr:MBL fold metallo-hydrolase [Pseudomonadales bacterium]